MKTRFEFQPDYAIHPGETLAETLEELGIHKRHSLSGRVAPLKTINEIAQGKAAITADTALQLERAISVPASFWNNAQRNYEAALARQSESKELEPSSRLAFTNGAQFRIVSARASNWRRKVLVSWLSGRMMLRVCAS